MTAAARGAGLGREEIVLVGFSRTLLVPLADVLPPDSVVVLEEPDIAGKRDVDSLVQEHPAVSRVVRCEYQRPDAIADTLRAQPALKAARAVLPGVEYAVAPAAQLADALALPGAGAPAGAVFRDKLRQREIAAACGIRNPAYRVVRSGEDAAEFLAAAGGPCVVKPTARQASLGVRFVETADEARAAVTEAAAATESLLEPTRGIPSQVVIERKIEGTEHSVEMLVAGGEPVFANVTAKRLLTGDRPVELGHVVPADVPASLASALTDHTARLAAGCGFGAGVLHAEWIVEADGPVLVECAARMPGDDIGTLISLAYGFPVSHAYLLVLLGASIELPATARQGAAIRFLTAPPGEVVSVGGVEAAAASPGVEAVRVTAQPGHVVRPVTSSWDRVGYVVACGPTGAAAESRAAAAASLVDIRTRAR